MLLISDEEVRQVLTLRDCIEALERAFAEEARGIAVNGKDGDVCADALQDLIHDRLRPGERGDKLYLLPMLLFPLGGEARKDRLLQRLFHDRKAIDRQLRTACARRRFRHATAERQ